MTKHYCDKCRKEIKPDQEHLQVVCMTRPPTYPPNHRYLHRETMRHYCRPCADLLGLWPYDWETNLAAKS